MGVMDSLLIGLGVVGIAALIAFPRGRSVRVTGLGLTALAVLLVLIFGARFHPAMGAITGVMLTAAVVGELCRSAIDVAATRMSRPDPAPEPARLARRAEVNGG